MIRRLENDCELSKQSNSDLFSILTSLTWEIRDTRFVDIAVNYTKIAIDDLPKKWIYLFWFQLQHAVHRNLIYCFDMEGYSLEMHNYFSTTRSTFHIKINRKKIMCFLSILLPNSSHYDVINIKIPDKVNLP